MDAPRFLPIQDSGDCYATSCEGPKSWRRECCFAVGGYGNRENFKTAIDFYCGGLDLYPRQTRMDLFFCFGFSGVDQLIGISIELVEQLTFAQKFSPSDISVLVTIHPSKPFGAV